MCFARISCSLRLYVILRDNFKKRYTLTAASKCFKNKKSYDMHTNTLKNTHRLICRYVHKSKHIDTHLEAYNITLKHKYIIVEYDIIKHNII